MRHLLQGKFDRLPTARHTFPREKPGEENDTMSSNESVIYNPGLIRDDTPGCGNSSIMTKTTAPGDKSNMIVTTSHPGTWTRAIDVYVPANYVRGPETPFMVFGDGGSTACKDLAAILDNLIQQ